MWVAKEELTSATKQALNMVLSTTFWLQGLIHMAVKLDFGVCTRSFFFIMLLLLLGLAKDTAGSNAMIEVLERLPSDSNVTDRDLMKNNQTARLTIDRQENEKRKILHEVNLFRRKKGGELIEHLSADIIHKANQYDKVLEANVEQKTQLRSMDMDREKHKREVDKACGGTYLHTLPSRDVVECDLCPPGHYVQRHCDHRNKTVCVGCPPHTFNSMWSRSQTCSDCHESCENNYGEVRTKDCTAVNDLQCECPEGKFRRDRFHCKNSTRCWPGYGVSKFGTGTTDTDCSKCSTGFYSDVSNNLKEPCKPWRNCTGDYIVDLAGNETHDKTCKKKSDGEITDNDESSRTGMIVGSVVGGIIVLAIIIGVACLIYRKRNRGARNADEERALAEDTELKRLDIQADGAAGNMNRPHENGAPVNRHLAENETLKSEQELHCELFQLVEDHLKEEDFENIKADCGRMEWIVPAQLQHIKTTRQLLDRLQDVGVIKLGDYQKLIKLLDGRRLKELSGKVEEQA